MGYTTSNDKLEMMQKKEELSSLRHCLGTVSAVREISKVSVWLMFGPRFEPGAVEILRTRV
jgi:hypothetical protein